MGVVGQLRQRRAARRWQRWTEVDPEDELARRAGIGVAFVLVFFGLLIVLVILGLVVAR